MSTTFVAFLSAPGDSIKKYDRSKSSQEQDDSVPQYFRDCMEVREEVFVKEQNVPPENELDGDDARSFHWVVHASVAKGTHGSGRKDSETSQVPVATVRLVPPPHPPHPALESNHKIDNNESTDPHETESYDHTEPYIKLGRLGTLPAYRGFGLGKLLVNTALEWAAKNPETIWPEPLPMIKEALTVEKGISKQTQSWNGLVLIHAQVDVEKMYARWGFVTDEGMGVWVEEGIRHVGMWMRLAVTKGI